MTWSLCAPKVQTRVVNAPGSDSMTANRPLMRLCLILSLGASEVRLGPVGLGELMAVVFGSNVVMGAHIRLTVRESIALVYGYGWSCKGGTDIKHTKYTENSW